ncbi:DUF484 family protein [Polynucleobacter necessarius]|uniref:DUF484 family protein n=1 Tax=Polynucleobacter necessarius TaxID=576610 RepID=UPI000E094D20|nr:DUF484 family protein [Polynucleobacter necessarius]
MSAIDPKQAEQEELVAEWLRATPGFFECYANLFNEIRIKHPHEDRAISLQERQMTVLRTQNQELNRRLSEMLHFGSRNDKTQQSLVAWLLRLMKANTKADVEAAIITGLAEVFEVEAAKLLSPNSAFSPWVDTPLCGSAKELAAASTDLLVTQVAISPGWQSMVAIGLPLGKSMGINSHLAVLLASKDETRFMADMGAFYLRQIAELTAAALDRIQAYEVKVD